MRKSKQKSDYLAVFDAVKAAVTQNLSERGLLDQCDAHMIDEYAKEIANAHMYGEKTLNTTDEKSLALFHRIRNASLNTANQLAKTLRIGPYGRDRFGANAEKTSAEVKPLSITHLSRKAK